MDWHSPLIVAAIVFVVFLVLRMWPAAGVDRSGPARGELNEARKKLESATSDAERVDALCAAGAASAKLVGGSGRAVQYYLRAMKLAPTSPEVIARAARGLARKPRGLETLLWRRLGAEAWSDADLPVVAAALAELEKLYDGTLKSAVRARALGNLANAIRSRAATSPTAARGGG